jgi:hypothetical protein
MINDSIIEYSGILFYNIIISHINMVRNEIADRVVVELLILLKKNEQRQKWQRAVFFARHS